MFSNNLGVFINTHSKNILKAIHKYFYDNAKEAYYSNQSGILKIYSNQEYLQLKQKIFN